MPSITHNILLKSLPLFPLELVSLYFPAQHPVDKGHIQSAAYHVRQQVVLPFLVAAGVKGCQRVKGHALSGAQCFQDRIRDARRVKMPWT